MRRTLETVKEWINPASGRHRTVPPLSAGLRPNERLDAAEELLPLGEFEPDDIAVTDAGEVVFSSDRTVFALQNGSVRRVADLSGRAGAIAVVGNRAVVAVDGVGLQSVDETGKVSTLCDDPIVAACVTAMTTTVDGTIVATVGSTTWGVDDWARALVTGDRSGKVITVNGSGAVVAADGLAWPSGIAVTDDGARVLLSSSLDHLIEERAIDALGRPGPRVASNLPVYPGRIVTAGDGGYWVTAPYPRNRVTELILDEDRLLDEMARTLAPHQWMVPQLRRGNPFTDTIQMGELRVLGEVKAWAPSRSCGVVFHLDGAGRVTSSVHARVDSPRHGVTGVAVHGDRLVIAVRGYRNVLTVNGTSDEG